MAYASVSSSNMWLFFGVCIAVLGSTPALAQEVHNVSFTNKYVHIHMLRGSTRLNIIYDFELWHGLCG